MDRLFGKTKQPDPTEQVRVWKRKIHHETRALDRQIRKIENEEFKIKQSIKQHVKNGNNDSAKVLAKGLVKSQKAKLRIHTTKAHMNSVAMTMQSQLSMMKQANVMKKSTAVMSAMNEMVCIPEVKATMDAMAAEMLKAGLIEEMAEDALSVLDDDDIEDAADVEVSKVLDELLGEKLNPLKVEDSELKVEEAEVEPASEELTARLAGLAIP